MGTTALALMPLACMGSHTCCISVLPRTVSAELKSKLSYMSTEVERLNQLAHEQAGYVADRFELRSLGSLSTTSLWTCWHTQALSASSHVLHPITPPASLHTIYRHPFLHTAGIPSLAFF